MGNSREGMGSNAPAATDGWAPILLAVEGRSVGTIWDSAAERPEAEECSTLSLASDIVDETPTILSICDAYLADRAGVCIPDVLGLAIVGSAEGPWVCSCVDADLVRVAAEHR